MKFNVFFGYKKKEFLYKNVFFEFEENKITVICGHNGAGKTTLLKLISGLLPSSISNTQGWYVPASGGLIQHFSLREHLDILKVNKKQEDSILVKNAFELFNVKEFENKRISELSTGQMMIASIIVAIASNNKLILLDEPFGSLDPTNSKKLASFLKKLTENEKTIIITSHDLYLSSEVGDNYYYIKNGKISWNSKNEDHQKHYTVEELTERYNLYA